MVVVFSKSARWLIGNGEWRPYEGEKSVKEVREALDLRPGQEVAVLRYRGRIELIPMRPVKEMRGLLRGIDSTIEREPDREL